MSDFTVSRPAKNFELHWLKEDISAQESVEFSDDIIRNIARKVAKTAKELAPEGKHSRDKGVAKSGKSKGKQWTAREAGSLKDSIRVKKGKKKKGGGYLVYVGGKLGGIDTYYFKWVEYGTHKMKPKPFMVKALMQSGGSGL